MFPRPKAAAKRNGDTLEGRLDTSGVRF